MHHLSSLPPILFTLLLVRCSLYWKIKYVSRLQYLWDDIKKGEIDIPEFVQSHDDILEDRPLTDYGIEPDPFHLNEVPTTHYSFGRYEERWASREFMSWFQSHVSRWSRAHGNLNKGASVVWCTLSNATTTVLLGEPLICWRNLFIPKIVYMI